VRFQLELANPRHGWLDVVVVLGERRNELVASSVLNDPVRELAELALFVMRGEHGDIAVRFWREPEWYELRATRGALTWRDYALAVPSPRVVASEILRALRELEPQISVDGDSERWAHPFPAAQVDALAALLRGP
jgi:hypothetical protein